jgi:serine/threonine-protein kinase
VSRNPEDACKDKVLLGRESCLREQCALPAFRDHAVCKQRREWESWREEERNRLLRGN